MKRSIRLFTLFTLLLFAVSACVANPISPVAPVQKTASLPAESPTNVPAPQSEEIAIVDGLGRAIHLSAPAKRIVTLAPSNTEILYAVQAGSSLVGRDDFSNFPPEATSVAAIGGSGGAINMEVITKLQPDLVLAAEITPPEQVKALEDLKIQVFYVPNPEDFEELFTNILDVGKLSGHEADAQSLVSSLKDRVSAVEKRLAGVKTAPTVFYELDATDPAKPWTSGPGTFIDYLLQRAAAKNIAGDMEGAWLQISQEELIVRNPDFILLGDSIFGMTSEMVKARPGWSSLKAVNSNQVLPFNDDLVSRPGPRMVTGLEELAKILHPELVP